MRLENIVGKASCRAAQSNRNLWSEASGGAMAVTPTATMPTKDICPRRDASDSGCDVDGQTSRGNAISRPHYAILRLALIPSEQIPATTYPAEHR
jgi:hypothetical protein